MTALSIAQRLGYISVVEELKVVTETTIASKHELIIEERYKVNIFPLPLASSHTRRLDSSA